MSIFGREPFPKAPLGSKHAEAVKESLAELCARYYICKEMRLQLGLAELDPAGQLAQMEMCLLDFEISFKQAMPRLDYFNFN